MPRKRHTAEQIIGKLREAEVELAQGKTTGEVCKKLGVTEQTYYRWRKEYGGLRVDQANRLNGGISFDRCGKFQSIHPRHMHIEDGQFKRFSSSNPRTKHG